MKYQVNISGMHCTGCKNLITMSLEEIGFHDVFVDFEKNTAQFSTGIVQNLIVTKLAEVFNELTGYNAINHTNIS